MIKHGFIYFGPIQCSYCRMNVTLCDIEVHQIIPVISTIIACLYQKKKVLSKIYVHKDTKAICCYERQPFFLLFFLEDLMDLFIFPFSRMLSRTAFRTPFTNIRGRTRLAKPICAAQQEC